MSEYNKSYRIKTAIGEPDGNLVFSTNLLQEYDTFEVLSLELKTSEMYKLHNSDYGIVVGRVIANNGFGIPNAKISIFVPIDINDNDKIKDLYPFMTTASKNSDGFEYNLLPNEKINGCHQVVGSFPTKRYLLDNDTYIEVFDKYYSYTTKTNNSGDYMICGVPVGSHTIHMDLDLSDCGILSQKPRDFVYKGYTIEQFETPTKFKEGNDYNNLSQIIRQEQVINVNPFWGNNELGETIGISRADINVNFKFETTCVFIGSIVSDNSSNGFNKKCIPTDNMGNMDELITGEGNIEMIRKTLNGNIESFSIKGKKLINADGVWCYQIPMNLDYVVTDEYGNIVPTDDPEKGIATRTSVRFRISLDDNEKNTENYFMAKVLVPHNPQIISNGVNEDYDYEFGTYTRDDSFRDLFFNNVYSVKSYIPRIQRHNNWKKIRFSGIKHCNNFGANNPMPYNNIRIRLPLMFTIMCALIKAYIFIVSIINTINVWMFKLLGWIADSSWFGVDFRENVVEKLCKMSLIVLKDGLCPDLENWYFAPCSVGNDKDRFEIDGCTSKKDIKIKFKKECQTNSAGLYFYRAKNYFPVCDIYKGPFDDVKCEEVDKEYNGFEDYIFWKINLLERTLHSIESNEFEENDTTSIDSSNDLEQGHEYRCLTTNLDYLISCIEMNLAQEYKVINFDFYNDWINGVIYNPRWVRVVKNKVKFLGITWSKEKVKGCMDDKKIFSTTRKYVQQCSVGYRIKDVDGYNVYGDANIDDIINLPNNLNQFDKELIIRTNNFHKKRGMKIYPIFGKNGGICHEKETIKGQSVYYLKPCEFNDVSTKKVNLFATDIILLGTFNECDYNGVPNTFQHLVGTTYLMPTNLAETNMDTNGPLYAKEGNTICVSDGNSSGTTENSGITLVEQTLENELNYYGDNDEYTIKDKDILDVASVLNDTMARTIAAGISWNYTGPGQGKIDERFMYYPGGHFLGLSCVNSQTNIKTCINLSRICEIGVNKSQSREDVRSNNASGLSYTYSVPTGLISGDEIVDTDFRTMFSTMNKKRLIANKIQKNTGYKYYNFEFCYPINFDGSLEHLMYKNTIVNPYNSKIDVIEEDLRKFGIFLGSSRYDYDAEESANTQTRTREYPNIDYYLFRFGLTYDDLKNNQSLVSNKFLYNPYQKDEKKLYYLPQYENSYYFYFGLKQGATAIDEFNKQFNSECDNLLIKKEPKLRLLCADYDVCESGGKIRVITEGLSLPYQNISVYHYKSENYILSISPTDDNDCIKYLNLESFILPEWRGQNHCNIEGLYYDSLYKITIVDADGLIISEEIKIQNDAFSFEYIKYDFNLPVGNNGINRTGIQQGIYAGGFLHIYNFNTKYDLSIFEYIKIKIKNEDGSYEDSKVIYSANTNNNECYLYANKKNTQYSIVIVYKCYSSNNECETEYDSISFDDNSKIKLVFDDARENYDILSKPYMSGMSETWWWDSNHYDIGRRDKNIEDGELLLLRKHFFKWNSEKDAFNTGIIALNGRKAIWGTPQSFYGANCDGISYCSLNDNTYPYIVDDSVVYFSTYGNMYSGHQFKQYSSIAFNGERVSGAYELIYSADTTDPDNPSLFLSAYTQNQWSHFKDGYGCVVKPVFGGNLIFTTYSNTLANYIYNENPDIKYAVVYPSFIYPVMKRPFYVSYEFVRWTNYDFIYNDNSELFINEHGKMAYINIHNGITKKRDNEEIGFDLINFGFGDYSSATTQDSDIYGLTMTGSTDRILNIKDFSIDVELNDDNNNDIVNIIQSDIDDTIPQYKSIDISVETNFYKEMYYYCDDSDNIIAVTFEGESNNDIAYYIGTISNSNNFLKSEGYLLKNVYPDYVFSHLYLVYFLSNKSNSSIKYLTVNITISLNFLFFVSYKYIDNFNIERSFLYCFYSDDITGSTFDELINSFLDKIYNGDSFVQYGINKDNNEWDFNNPVNKNYVFDIKPIKKNVFTKNPVYNNVNYNSFRPLFEYLYNNEIIKPITEGVVEPLNIGNNDIVFGIGVKKTANEIGDEMSYSYKLYTNPFENFDDDDAEIPNAYLTFTAEQNNSTIRFTKTGSTAPTVYLEYSLDKGKTWTDYTYNYTITLNNIGDSVKFRGNNDFAFYKNYYNYNYFVMTGKIKASGHITSLNNNFGFDYALNDLAYHSLFNNCSSLTTAPILPSTTLNHHCYTDMFYSCTSLKTAPELPATTLANYCYSNMFADCTSLTTAPELPATQLVEGCYGGMFYNCTSLTTAPELPATTLADYCYVSMFQDCTSLTTAPELPATGLTDYCYSSMFQNCTSLTTAPNLPATTLVDHCYASMFQDCTSLITPINLPATQLADYCYDSMFYNCININYIKALFLDEPSDNYTYNWISNVSERGYLVLNSDIQWDYSDFEGLDCGYPTGWTVTISSE